MKVIDLTSKAQALSVRLDPSPVYDMLAAVYVAENWAADRGFEVERRWVQRTRAALGPDLRRDLRVFARERGFVMGLVSFLGPRPGITVPEFLKLVAAAPPLEVVERMLTSPRAARPTAPLLHEAVRSRRESALAAFLDAYPKEYDVGRVHEIVGSPPAEIQHRVLRLLRTFHAGVYAPEEAQVLPLLRADVEAKMVLAGALSPHDLIERTTGGVALGPDTEISQVVLAPSYFFRPYNLISEYPGVRVFVYPVDLAPAEGASPTRDLALLFKALGDETRLRVLAMLAEREMYLQEIANRLGVTHVTAIHHLALLRAARLVRAVERGSAKYYQLRPEAVSQVGPRLRTFVGITRGTER